MTTKTFEEEISAAMDLIDNVIGPIDFQTHNPHEVLGIPDDAEFEVTLKRGEIRGLSKAWHALSEVLKTIRSHPVADASKVQRRLACELGKP